MSELVSKNITQIKNEIISYLINDKELLRSLVVIQKDFLNEDLVLDDETKNYLKNPSTLIRKKIFPYKKGYLVETEKNIMITIEVNDFSPTNDEHYRNGVITLYVLCPVDYEETKYGVRCDWIADRIENIFSTLGSNIGDFTCKARGDIPVNDKYIGHYVAFEMLDYYVM